MFPSSSLSYGSAKKRMSQRCIVTFVLTKIFIPNVGEQKIRLETILGRYSYRKKPMNLNRLTLVAVATLTLSSVALIPANAQTTAISNIIYDALNQTSSVSNFSLGFEFTVNSDITVTQLGAFDDNGDGLTQRHQIGLYRVSDQALLSSATVTNSSTLDGIFRYEAIDPVNLVAKQNYIVTGVYTDGGDKFLFNSDSFSSASAITFVGSRFASSSTLVYPNTNGVGENGYFSANFKFNAGNSAAASPEPASLAFVLPFVGVVIARRKRSH